MLVPPSPIPTLVLAGVGAFTPASYTSVRTYKKPTEKSVGVPTVQVFAGALVVLVWQAKNINGAVPAVIVCVVGAAVVACAVGVETDTVGVVDAAFL